MAKIKNSSGFLGNFMAHNVNISAPKTNAKWSQLRHQIIKESNDLLQRYEGNKNLYKAIDISKSNNTPDELLEFAKSFWSFVSSADTSKMKDDSVIFDIAGQLADVAKHSYDKRAIELAIMITKELVSLKQ